MLIDRNIINHRFSYKPNQFNYRSEFPEEKYSFILDLLRRIDYWKYVLRYHCNLSKQQKIHISLSHISLDYFALILAICELSMIVVSDIDDADYIIHNNINLKTAKANNHIFDIADLGIDNKDLAKHVANKQPKENSFCYDNLTHKELYQQIFSNEHKISGSVLYLGNFDFIKNIKLLLHCISSDTVTFHMGLGYNCINDGLGKIILLLLSNDIDNVILEQDVELKIKNLLDVNKKQYPNFITLTD